MPTEVDLETLSEFQSKLRRSGYNREQSREIIESGIKGFFSKMRRGQIHRPVEVIQQGGEIGKVIEQSTWFLPKERQEEEPENKYRPSRGRRGRRGNLSSNNKPRNPFAPVAPIFIPRTQGGALLDRLRRVEERLTFSGPGRSSTTPKLKLVEQAGVMLRAILTKSNPWSDAPCDHPQCSTCDGDKPGDCKVRNIVYTNQCMICKEGGWTVTT